MINIRNVIKLLIESQEEHEYFGDSLKGLIDKPEDFDVIDDEAIAEDYKDLDNVHFVKNDYYQDPTVDLLEKQFGKLEIIGKGTFRTVFKIPGNNDVLLKVAHKYSVSSKYNPIAMNKEEVTWFNRYPRFFPKVYFRHPEFKWFVVEKVTNIKSDSEFYHIAAKNFRVADPDIMKKYLKILMEEMLFEDFTQYLDYFDISFGVLVSRLFDKFLINEGFFHYKDIEKFIKKDCSRYLKNEATEYISNESDPDIKKGILNFIYFLEDVLYSGSSNDKIENVSKLYYEDVTSDGNLRKLLNICEKLNIAMWDFRKENIGTDENREKFIIIDGSMLT